MCDRIIMPDGKEIESIKGDGECLCGNSQREILTWIVEHLPVLEFDDVVSINHDPFGYYVSIAKKDAQGRVSKVTDTPHFAAAKVRGIHETGNNFCGSCLDP